VTRQQVKDRVVDLQFDRAGDRLVAIRQFAWRASFTSWETGDWAEDTSGELPVSANKVVVSPNGRWVANMEDDQTVRLWDMETGKELARLPHDEAIYALAFAPDGQTVATWSRDGTASIWPPPSGVAAARFVHDQDGDPRYVTDVAFSPDGRRLATGGFDDSARIWDVATARQLARVDHSLPVNRVAFSEDGDLVASAEVCYSSTPCDQVAVVLSAAENGQTRTLLPHEATVTALAFAKVGARLATGTFAGKVRVWDTASGAEVGGFDFDSGNEVRALSFSPDGSLLAVGEGCPSFSTCKAAVRIWDVAAESVAREVTHDDGVRALCFDSGGGTLVTTSSDRTVRAWNVLDGAELWTLRFDHPVDAVAFAPRDQWLALGGEGGPEGTTSGVLRIFEATSRKEIARVADEWPIKSVAFSPDGNWVATANGADVYDVGAPGFRARIFEAATGQEIARMDQEGRVDVVRFSPDGKWLATAGQEHAALWLWRREDIIDVACTRLRRNLSPDEWMAVLGNESYSKSCPQLPTPGSLPIASDKRYLTVKAGESTE
jgi:WD40 repeat protein